MSFMEKLCPICSISMSASDVSGVQVDSCPSCAGAWLDRGELVRLSKSGADAIREAEGLQEREGVAPKVANSSCPSCGKPLYHYRYAGSDVELDTCPNHCGIWLDNGELERIALRLEEGIPGEARATAVALDVATEQARRRHKAIEEAFRAAARWTYTWP